MKKFVEKIRNFFKNNKKLSTVIMVGLLCLCVLGTGIGLFIHNNVNRGGGTSQIDPEFNGTTGYDYIDEIWNGDNFDKNNLLKLIQYTSGMSVTSLGDISAVTSKVNSTSLTANNMRSYVNNGKTSGNDVVVKLGGLDWTATYLSKDMNGNVILTLWLANSSQLEGKIYDSNKDVFGAFGLATWNVGTNAVNNAPYPDSMYGTSYIRSVVLNNGGRYNDYINTSLTTATQNPDSVFAPFTMGDISKYIIQPKNVAWQLDQSAKKQGIFSYNCPNESIINPSDGWQPNTNYQAKVGYTAWAEDYLWLPSITETGYNDGIIGIWNTSTNQRANTAVSWLRSGYYGNVSTVIRLNDFGTSYTPSNVINSFAVRPALHLNLTAAARTASFDYIGEIWNGNGFDYQNLVRLVRYTAGVSGVSVSTVTNKLASGNITANVMKGQATGKTSGNDIIVTFGGLDWTPTYLSKNASGDPILTLWLANSTQLSGKTYAAGKTFDANGTTTWNSGITSLDNPTSAYPDNMYSTSYIRSVVLNNGGRYKKNYNDTTLTTATQNPNSVFAPFTIGDIKQYLVQPKNVPWQVSGQSARQQYGFLYNQPNECLNNPSDGWSNASYNYQNKSGYTDWGNDYIWIPSLTETGYSDSAIGMWNTSVNQRVNATDTWLRSGGNYARYIYYLRDSGADYYWDVLENSFAVRPAIHLNLAAAISRASYKLSIVFDTETLWTDAPDNVTWDLNDSGIQRKISKGESIELYGGGNLYSTTYKIVFTVTSSTHDYGVIIANRSSRMTATYQWRPTTNQNLTLKVTQLYTITFNMGYADSGTPPKSVTKSYGNEVEISSNGLTHLGFTPNGWYTNPEGEGGTAYKDLSIYTANADLTLYPNWTPVYSNVNLSVVTLDGSGGEISLEGGSLSATRKYASNNQAIDGTATSSYTTLSENISIITATTNGGYTFLGFNTTRSMPTSVTTPSSTYSITPAGGETYDVYAYFKRVSDNVLKYDRDEQYWYFEDGMYPQSEVDSSLAATLDGQSFSVAEYTLYFNNGSEMAVPVYTYNGNKYARATVNGISKWFVVEPIRWRVSEYGVSEDVKPDLWQNYGDTKSLVAVSEKILFASIMTADRINDSKPTESKDFWLNNYVTTGEFQLNYDGSFSHSQDSFLGAGSQDVSQSGTVSTNVAVYSNSDATLSSTAKLTAFASFLLYGTTAYADTYDTYWTRDLETTDGRSEYGCGVVVTSYGSESLRWLNQMCGVRLSYYCTEVSRY